MSAPSPEEGGPSVLPFPPVTKEHILNCSYHRWHPKYRAVTPKARLIPLPPQFLDYLRSDGIILPPDENDNPTWSDSDSGIFSGTDNNDDGEEEETPDPSVHWQDTHAAIERTIAELGGSVAPKLNWSAPKDATWIAATNSMECRTPNDIYLLLKSSDFVTHDLTHAFDDTANEPAPDPEISYHLVLRKWITLNPSVEFRCFVRNRQLIALCQRDLNHFEFLFTMQDKLRQTIQDFFDTRLRDTFPDPYFTFDVYIPPPHGKVWLVDFNPWAMRTDPLVFSWMELLTMEVPDMTIPQEDKIVRLQIVRQTEAAEQAERQAHDGSADTDDDTDDDDVEDVWQPEFRLIRKDDPEAYGFATPQYSAHKLPRDVVDASRGGEGQLREFAQQWEQAQKLAAQEKTEDSEDD